MVEPLGLTPRKDRTRLRRCRHERLASAIACNGKGVDVTCMDCGVSTTITAQQQIHMRAVEVRQIEQIARKRLPERILNGTL